MPLNTLLDLEFDLFDKETIEDYSFKFKETWVDCPNETKDPSMEEANGEDCELLLTDYLLNFDEEDVNDCSYDRYSSGVECSEDEGECSLASLKMSLKKSNNNSDTKNNVAVKPKKNIAVTKCVADKKESEKPATKGKKDFPAPITEKELEKKERDRARSKVYRAKRTTKLHKAEEECSALRENNKLLCQKNEELTEKVTSLEEQVEYLKSVIANGSALSSILSTLTKNSGLEFQRNPLTCSSIKRKRENNGMNEDNNNCTKKKCLSESEKNGGICLHLAPGRMSLEFCKECHKSSNMENE